MTRPPVGAALLGFIALITGAVDILQGLRFLGVVAFGPGELGGGLAATGAFALLLGIGWLALAYGFWTIQSWAWLIGMILAVVGILNAILVLFTTESLATGLGVALLPIVVIWYLQQADIKRVFNIAE
jgi:hypothetical protein